MKKFIKSLELRLSDLCLFVGLISFAIFLIFGQLFMQYQNPHDVALPLWATIITLIVMLASFGGYLYLEVYLKKEKINPVIAGGFAFILLLNFSVILATPFPNVF